MARTPFDLIRKGASRIINEGKEAIRGIDSFAPDTKLGIARNTILGIPQATRELRDGTGAFADNTKLGIARNTVTGLPQAAKETFVPGRGYSDEEIRKAGGPAGSDLSPIERVKGAARVGAEIPVALGGLLGSSGRSPAARFSQTKLGGKLADAGEAIERFSQPKSARDAAAMRFADAVSFIPVGSAKAIGSLANVSDDFAKFVAKSSSKKAIRDRAAQEGIEVTDNIVDLLVASKRPKDVDNIVGSLKTKTPEDVAKESFRETLNKAYGNRPSKVDSPTQLQQRKATPTSLTQEARKYKSAEEFVRKYAVEESYDMTPGVTRLADTSETGLYHGAGSINLKSILSDGKLRAGVSKMDNLGEKTLSASGNRSVANSYGVVFELDDTLPKRVAPRDAIKGDVYDAFEYRIDEDVPLSKVKNVTIPLNKGEGLETKILWNYPGKTPEYITAKELAKQFEAKGIKVIFNDGSNLTKSQLTDIWNKAKQADTTPTPASPIQQVASGKNGSTEVIAMETPPPKTTVKRITQSDVDNTQFRDIGGIAGGKSLNLRDTALSVDNLDAFEMAARGDVGPTTKAFYNFKNSEANNLKWKNDIIRKLASDFKGISKKELNEISKFRLGLRKELPPKLQKVNKDITKVTDQIRNDYNAWARSVGKPEIGYVDDYLTKRVAQTGTPDGKRTGVGEGFTKTRTDGELPGIQETDLGTILARYINNVGDKMYLEPALNQLSEMADVLRGKGVTKGAEYIDNFITDTLNPAVADNFAEKFANTIIGARSTAALAANVVWTTFTQPLSLALTFGRNPSIPAIVKGTVKEAPLTRALYQGLTGKDSKWIKDLPTFRQKTEVPMSVAGIGDISAPGLKPRVGGKRETFNKAVGFYADAMESTLSRISASVAREYGQSIGMKGELLDTYSDLMVGLTQSEYLRSARPEAMRNIWVRFFAPFQTYAFEAYRYGKTLVGAPGGGLPIKKKSQRAKQVLFAIVAMEGLNWMQEQVTGRRVNTPGSSVPLVGAVVDDAISRGASAVTGKDVQLGYGRTPVAPYEDYVKLGEAFVTYVNKGNINPMRKEITKWAMGLTGIGGASTVNRLVDGVLANIRGYEQTRSGNYAFPIEGADRWKSLILGTYATDAGKQYIDGGFKPPAESEIMWKSLQEMPEEDRIATLKLLKENNPQLYDNVKKQAEDEKAGVTDEDRSMRNLGVANKERAAAIYTQLKAIPSGDERVEYLRDLKRKKILTKEVEEQVKGMMSGKISTEDERLSAQEILNR